MCSYFNRSIAAWACNRLVGEESLFIFTNRIYLVVMNLFLRVGNKNNSCIRET